MDFVIHRHLIDRLAFANSLVSGLALYPQVWNVLTTRLVEGISILTFSLILINSLVWILYAIHRNLISLGVASILNAIASGILLLVTILLSY